jgi:hypothetical protein
MAWLAQTIRPHEGENPREMRRKWVLGNQPHPREQGWNQLLREPLSLLLPQSNE